MDNRVFEQLILIREQGARANAKLEGIEEHLATLNGSQAEQDVSIQSLRESDITTKAKLSVLMKIGGVLALVAAGGGATHVQELLALIK